MATTISDLRPFAAVRAAPRARQPAPPSLYQCLVLSAHDQHCQWLDVAAQRSGWETVICQDMRQASRQIARCRYALAVIDLTQCDEHTEAGFRQAAETLARADGPLLVVCGREDDATEEIWARQIGAWVYLPGIESECDIEQICDEARRAADQLMPRRADYAAIC